VKVGDIVMWKPTYITSKPGRKPYIALVLDHSDETWLGDLIVLYKGKIHHWNSRVCEVVSESR